MLRAYLAGPWPGWATAAAPARARPAWPPALRTTRPPAIRTARPPALRTAWPMAVRRSSQSAATVLARRCDGLGPRRSRASPLTRPRGPTRRTTARTTPGPGSRSAVAVGPAVAAGQLPVRRLCAADWL